MASITVNTNGQTLTVNASISHWTSAALAVVASGDDDIPSTTTTTIGADYTMHFANTATVVTVTVKQLDGTVLFAQELQCSPAVGPRTLNPAPSPTQAAADLKVSDVMKPSAAIAETFPRAWTDPSNSTVLSSGRMSVFAVALPKGVTVSSITFLAATTALDTGTAQWFALYSSSLALLGQTDDDTNTAWAANAAKTLDLAAPHVTTYAGLHYLGINVTASTAPTLLAMSVATAVNGLPPILCATSTTGLTATAPDPAGSLTAQNRFAYAYVS